MQLSYDNYVFFRECTARDILHETCLKTKYLFMRYLLPLFTTFEKYLRQKHFLQQSILQPLFLCIIYNYSLYAWILGSQD